MPLSLSLQKKCKYGVVEACARDMGWSVRKEVINGRNAGGGEEKERKGGKRWDLFWTDTSVSLQVRTWNTLVVVVVVPFDVAYNY